MADNKVDAKEPAQAIAALAEMIKSADPETKRAGKRQLWEIVRHVGRPGNAEQVQTVVTALVELLAADQPAAVKREALWAMSELGGNEIVEPVAALLSDKEVREDACMVLERLPGDQPVAALKAALKSVPKEFVINVAHSLRARGIAAEGPPCQKLVPTKQTSVTPVGRK
ncbi:MAG: HEAT repeat domain-containing protein [Pirellulaceae bacterium]